MHPPQQKRSMRLRQRKRADKLLKFMEIKGALETADLEGIEPREATGKHQTSRGDES